MHTPSGVYSHLQKPQQKLHWQTVMPLNMQQTLHKPPASILHKFCRVPQATGSSQVQLILQPSLHFSTVRVQRGSTHQLAVVGLGVEKPCGKPLPEKPIALRSIKVALVI